MLSRTYRTHTVCVYIYMDICIVLPLWNELYGSLVIFWPLTRVSDVVGKHPNIWNPKTSDHLVRTARTVVSGQWKKNKKKKQIKTRTQIHLKTRNRIFQRKHKFSLLKSVIIEREREKKFYVDWAVCNVLGRYLSVFRFLRKRSKWKKTKKKQTKKVEVCKLLDSKHEGHKKNPSLCKR